MFSLFCKRAQEEKFPLFVGGWQCINWVVIFTQRIVQKHRLLFQNLFSCFCTWQKFQLSCLGGMGVIIWKETLKNHTVIQTHHHWHSTTVYVLLVWGMYTEDSFLDESQPFWCLLFIYIYLKGKVMKINFSSTGSLFNSQDWAKPKPRAWNCISVSQTGGRSPLIGVITCCPPGYTSKGLHKEQNTQEVNWHSKMGCGHPMPQLSPLCYNTHLESPPFKNTFSLPAKYK